jgi:hypothetical protein
MTNGDQGSLFLQAMDDIFPKFYSGQDPQELGPEPQFDFNAYLGEYKNEDLRARITQDEQTLLLHWNGRNPLKLKSKSRDEFSIVGLKSTIKIERDDAGTISALNIHQSDTVQRLDAVARKN